MSWAIITIIIIALLYQALAYINNVALFAPIPADNPGNALYISSHGCQINYIHLSHTNSNKLFIYAHGNSGNIYLEQQNPLITTLNKFDSVLLFDYRGYGSSTCKPSELGIKQDMLSIWNYSLNLGYTPNQIILVGHSLGTSVTTWLVSELMHRNQPYPRTIINIAGFYSLRRLVGELTHPYFKYLVTNDFNTANYVSKIKKYNPSYPILLLHSRHDELINYSHSKDLAQQYGLTFKEINGTHNDIQITDDIITDYLKKIEHLSI